MNLLQVTFPEEYFHPQHIKDSGDGGQGRIAFPSFYVLDGCQTDTSHLRKIPLRNGKGLPT